MIQKDRMFKMVISNSRLVADYKYDPDDYPDCASGLGCENAVVAAVAMIVDNISSDLAQNKLVDEKTLYNKVFNLLNDNLLYAN